jgi:hypothetical protein
MANPFYINPPNPLEALMLGAQGYEGAQKRGRESDLLEARRQAGELAASGDYKGALGASFRGGDIQGANVLASLMEKQFGRSADANTVFGTPIYGKTADGKEGIGTFDKGGNFRLIDTKGFQVTPGIKTIDTGTGTLIVGARSGAPVGPTQQMQGPAGQGQVTPSMTSPTPIAQQPTGFIPKNTAAAKADEVYGTKTGEAQVNLPTIMRSANQALKTVEQLRTHPGKQYAIGAQGVVPGIPGTQQRGYIALLNQAKGQTFIQAFESLKGGGAITEIEGLKGEQALARLDRAQTMEDYDAALKDLEDVIRTGIEVAKTKARPIQGQTTQGKGGRLKFNPATGDFE